MALFKEKDQRGLRVFMVRRGDETRGIRSAYLTFDDASNEAKAEHLKRLIAAQATNKGAYLDAEHRLKKADEEAAFVRSLIVAAYGFEVADGAGTRELAWPADADRILALLDDGLLALLKTTIDDLNFPRSFERFENGAASGRRELPNF